MRTRFIFCFYIFWIVSILLIPVYGDGQTLCSGRVIDGATQNPVQGVEVRLKDSTALDYTNENGEFLLTGVNDINDKSPIGIGVSGELLLVNAVESADIHFFSLSGQTVRCPETRQNGQRTFDFTLLPDGLYLFCLSTTDQSVACKIRKHRGMILPGAIQQRSSVVTKSASARDTLVFSKDGYYTQESVCLEGFATYEILNRQTGNIDYLHRLIRPEAFNLLESDPLNSSFSEVKSVKVVYDILENTMYYINSVKYPLHYDFCTGVLGYNKGQSTFNLEMYTRNPNRKYILATLNHFTSSTIYAFEFLVFDELTCEEIRTVYNHIAETFFNPGKLRFYANNTTWSLCEDLPVISSGELFAGQNYQPLNLQVGYGYLKKVDQQELKTTYLGPRDIVMLNSLPGELAVVAGIITTEFQTPLSHINVLSHNRGTPNMALRDAWTNPGLNTLIGKLVCLKVGSDSFSVREVALDEARQFWAAREPGTPHVLGLDTLTSGLVELTTVGLESVNLIGGKAANFAELTKIKLTNEDPIPLPEGYFAIPFYYYWKHISQYGLDKFIGNMLIDPVFNTDYLYRQARLKILRDSIKSSPLDPALIERILKRISNPDGFTAFRFRSSTNAEDIDGFNGAGLYESKTGKIDDPDKPVDEAIKKVWASLWDFAAFEERDYFKIDHQSVAMGVLVHRSYPAEAANGVAITENIYNPYKPAITINVQVGEISVVEPDDSYLPDQILFYTRLGNSYIEYINHTTVPGMEGKTVMSDDELTELKGYCQAIHQHYCRLNLECRPIDIEFKVDVIGGNRKIYIKQARLY